MLGSEITQLAPALAFMELTVAYSEVSESIEWTAVGMALYRLPAYQLKYETKGGK